MTNLMRTMSLSLIAAAVVLAAACNGDDEADALASARNYMTRNDNKAAIIQLKSILQSNPSAAEARFLLGRALLHSGDAAAATLELVKARELKHPEVVVVPELVRAMLVQGQFKQVVERFDKTRLDKARENAELRTLVALAYARLGQMNAAEAAVAEALAAVPQLPDALLFRARVLAGRSDIDGALKLIDDVLASGQLKADALLLRGDIQIRARRDPAAAIDSYRQVLVEVPASLLAHMSIIAILISERKVDAAEVQYLALKKAMPQHPQTKYVEAQIAYLRDDVDSARTIIEQLIRAYPNGASLRQFSGAIDLRRNALLQAEVSLAKALQLDPELVHARRLLAQTYLQMGQPEKALSTLAPLLSEAQPAAETLVLAADAHVHSGDHQRAGVLYSRVAKLGPTDPGIRTALALSELAKGKSETAFAELQSIAEGDKGSTADLALISSRLRRGELDKALLAIDHLERKQPKHATAANLRGRIQLMRRENVAARASFEHALKLEPAFYSATVSLAALDVVDQKLDQARQRFESALKANPKNTQARLELANLRIQAGADAADIEKLLNEAVTADSANSAARLALIRHHTAHKDSKQAFSAAQAAAAALPEDIEVLEALGQLQAAAGDSQQAIRTFTKISTIQPKLAMPYGRLADAHAASKDMGSAGLAIKRGLEAAPDSVDLQRRLIAHSRQTKDFASALLLAKAMQKSRPTSANGFILEADIEAAQKKWPGAIAAYQLAIGKDDMERRVPGKLHTALLQSGRVNEAEAFTISWLKARPKDATFRTYLGDRAVVANNGAAAEKYYSEAAKLEPRSVQALNNLAWFMAERGQKGAVEIAKRAVVLAPNSPAILDTLAKALDSEGSLDGAIAVQKRAVALAPSAYGLQLNLARLYVKAGKRSEALAELEKVAAAGAKYAGQAEVTKLKKEIGG